MPLSSRHRHPRSRLRSTGNAAGTGAVPEPATWAMLILGFGCIGLAIRRRTAIRIAGATA